MCRTVDVYCSDINIISTYLWRFVVDPYGQTCAEIAVKHAMRGRGAFTTPRFRRCNSFIWADLMKRNVFYENIVIRAYDMIPLDSWSHCNC